MNSTAQMHLEQGEWQSAIEILLPEYNTGQFNNQSLFILGMAYKAQNKYTEAEKYLNELLLRDSGAMRVKLELAEVHYRIGNTKKAKQLLHEVKASNPPIKVGENIDAFIAFIESGSPKAWSLYASFGILYDTNANQGPSTDTVLMYGLPFNLDKDARSNRDWANIYKIGASYNHIIDGNFVIQGGLNLSYNDYNKLNRFDALSMSFNAGPSWMYNQWSFSLPYIFNIVKIGHEEDWYSISNGIAPQFGYQINPRLFMQGSFSWQDKRYKGNKQRDGEATTLNASLRYAIDNSSYISTGAYIGEEDSGIKTSSNDSYGANVGYYKAFNNTVSMYMSPSYSKTDYDGTEVAYAKSRKDERIDFTTNLNYLVESWGANLTLSYTHTNNKSNIEMYRFKRNQTMLSIMKNFK